MVVSIGGNRQRQWQSVGSEGEVLDLLVRSRQDKKAAVRRMRKLLRRQGLAPSVQVTVKLRSYGAAMRNLVRGSTARTICPGRLT
jgi:putative transposase